MTRSLQSIQFHYLTDFKKNEFTLLFSTVTQDELENAPEKVKELVKGLKIESTEFLDTTDEAVDLATEYIAEKVVGQTSYADCLHIALATINRADFLSKLEFQARCQCATNTRLQFN